MTSIIKRNHKLKMRKLLKEQFNSFDVLMDGYLKEFSYGA